MFQIVVDWSRRSSSPYPYPYPYSRSSSSIMLIYFPLLVIDLQGCPVEVGGAATRLARLVARVLRIIMRLKMRMEEL